MKRIRIVQIINIILFIIYITLFILELSLQFVGDKKNIIFSFLLAILSGSMLYKGALLKSESSLWFSISLILYAILITALEINEVNYSDFYYLFTLIPIISSFINLVVFFNLLYIKVIILNISIFIPIIIIKYLNMDWWWLVLISMMSILLGILLCRMIKFNRENS